MSEFFLTFKCSTQVEKETERGMQKLLSAAPYYGKVNKIIMKKVKLDMDLIQVGVSVTGSLKKRILCVSPKAGPAQPAAPSGHYILYTTCV